MLKSTLKLDTATRGSGSTGELHARSPMSLVNVAYRDTLTWAHPSLRSLEEQALVPMLSTSPVEHGLQGHQSRVYGTIGGDPMYRRLFAKAFPGVDYARHHHQYRDGALGLRTVDRLLPVALRSLP